MEFKQVKSFGFSRITNAYHVAFFSTFRAIINEHGAERLNLPEEIVDEFSDLLDAEQIVVNRSRASGLTAEMLTYDRQRDNFFRIVFYKLKAASLSTDTVKLPAEVVNTITTHLVKVYPISIVDDAYHVETAKINGLLADIERLIKPYVETIGIDNDIKELAKANTLFEQGYIGRVSERAQSENTKELRANTEQLYFMLINHLNMNANTRSTEESAVAAAQQCVLTIDEVNQLIDEYKTKTASDKNNPEEEDEYGTVANDPVGSDDVSDANS